MYAPMQCAHNAVRAPMQELEDVEMEAGGGATGTKRSWEAALGGAGTSAGTGGTKRQRAARYVCARRQSGWVDRATAL